MKFVSALALLAVSASVQAQQGFVDRARVLSVEPQYDNVQVPRQECRNEWVTETRQPAAGGPNYGGVIVGGVAGGILGNQVGKGSGREAATAVGAVVGAIAGDRIASQNAQQQPEVVQREVRNCRTVYDVQNRINGYRVTYDYRGHQSTVVTRDHPGNSLAVRVSITPAE
jgi:uncharacterized protein YcfJ